MNSAPALMVSSTFYDLRQVRTDLAHFISDELGYVALLSELDSFPVDPDINTVENCRTRVERYADILVLIVGGRYGSIDDHRGTLWPESTNGAPGVGGAATLALSSGSFSGLAALSQSLIRRSRDSEAQVLLPQALPLCGGEIGRNGEPTINRTRPIPRPKGTIECR